MINNPEFAIVKGKKYKINTDFKVALRCEKVAQDDSIEDTERALAIIYMLFGEKGLDNSEDLPDLMKAAQKFLACGNDLSKTQDDVNMDYEQDEKYIKTSFLSDYNIDLSTVSLHWWDFFDLLNGLSENTILSRVRQIRSYNLNDIKDGKEREKMQKQKELVALKPKKKKPLTAEQQKNLDKFYELTGIRKEQ